MKKEEKEYLATADLTGHFTVLIRENEDGEKQVLEIKEVDGINYMKDVQKLD